MSGIFYIKGEQKARPGVYQRYEQPVSTLYDGIPEGIVGCVFASNWGKLNQPCELSTMNEAVAAFGPQVDVIREIIDGGATVLALRVGAESTGEATTAQLADGTSEPVLDVTAKYPGARAFSYAVRYVLGSETGKEFVLYESGRVIETIAFDAVAGTEAESLIQNGAASAYLTFTQKAEYIGSGDIAIKLVTAMTLGTNPTVANSEYAAGLAALEPCQFGCIVSDSNDADVHALIKAFVNRVYKEGKCTMAVVGEPTSVPFETRLQHAVAFNDYQIVYVGGGWVDASDITHDGYRAAARIAGMIMATPSSEAITHKPILGAVYPKELLTISQLDKANMRGMMVFCNSPTNSVWIDSGITTLTAPTGNDDIGFKKIKRTRVRFEVMERVNATVAPMIGTIPNTEDGRAAVIQRGQGVLNAMVAEVKLMSGAEMTVDSENPPFGDSAWFILAFQDVDALEKIYLCYSIGGLISAE